MLHTLDIRLSGSLVNSQSLRLPRKYRTAVRGTALQQALLSACFSAGNEDVYRDLVRKLEPVAETVHLHEDIRSRG